MKKLFRNIDADIQLIAIVAIVVLAFQVKKLKEPYWRFESQIDNCELYYDGWSWDLEAYYSRINSDVYYNLSIDDNALNLLTKDLPKFYSFPEKISVGHKSFWLAWDSTVDANVLALDEEDEEGRDLSLGKNFSTHKSFLRALQSSGAISYDYINEEAKERSEKQIVFESVGRAAAIDQFLACTRSI